MDLSLGSFQIKAGHPLYMIKQKWNFIIIVFRMQAYGFGFLPHPLFNSFMPLQQDQVRPSKHISHQKNPSDSQSFQPQYHQIKKLGLKLNKKKLRIGGWTAVENQTYLDFMIQNQHDFLNQRARRTSKVFYRLSKVLKRRTPDQCRSHHQKLQMKCNDDLFAIINEVRRKIQSTIAEDYVNQQHRLHHESLMQFKSTMKTGQDYEEEYIVQRDWYNIKGDGGCLKIQIIENKIKEWVAK